MAGLINVQYGPLSIVEAAGNLSIDIDGSVSVGGGKSAGLLSAQGKGGVVLEAGAAVDLGLQLLAAKSPTLAAIIAAAKPFIDAEIAAH